MSNKLLRRRRLIAAFAVPLLTALCVSSLSAPPGHAATSGGDTSPVNLATPVNLANGVASQGAVVTATNARFEVLTSGVIRMEYSPTSSFLDTPTWNIINRNLPVPSYTANVSGNVLTISTSAMTLQYKVGSGPFGPTNTTVTLLNTPYSGAATVTPTWSGECVYGQVCQSNTATLNGGTSLTISNAGFVSQGGEISGLGTSGSTATWSVLGVPAAGSGTVTIRYDNGSGSTSSMSLVVNGQTYTVSLPATGGWGNWSTVTQTVSLNAGTNTVETTCPNSSACNLTVDTIGVSAVGATPQPALPAGQLGGYNRSYDNSTYSGGNLPSPYGPPAVPAAGGTTCATGQSGDTCTDNIEALQPGLLDTSGWFLLDDTHTAVWTSDGWTAARPSGDVEDGYLFGYGENYTSALTDLAKLTGSAPMLPESLFGNWYSDFYAYSESDYKNTILPDAQANGVSLDDLSVDTYWHSPDVWASWEFNSTLFPNPPEFFAWANGQHLYVDLALHGQIPVSDPQAAATQSIAGGSLAQAGCPTFAPTSDTCYVFDWGNESQAEAYFNLVQELSNDGANFYWLDWCCEASTVSTPGVDPDGWIAQLSAQQMIDNGDRGFVLSRAGASNLQPLAGRYPSGAWADHRSLVHFTGDAYATWSLISDEIQRTTGEASIGEPYVSDDIGGFYAPPGTSNDPDDLYLRFLQMGVFQPIMRLHSSNLNRLPWQFDSTVTPIGDAFMQLRESLVPYLYGLSNNSVATGQPMAQALYLDYPSQAAAYSNPNEYLLGPQMLVAPVTTAGTDPQVSVWLPPGTWTDWFTGTTYTGPSTQTLSVPLNQMPVFIKAGGIVPLQPASGHADTADTAPLTLKVYAGANGSYSLYEDAGKGLGYQQGQSRTTPVTYSQSGTSSTLTVGPSVGTYPGAPTSRSYSYQLVGVSSPASVLVNGQSVSSWSYNSATDTLTVTPPAATVTQPLTITTSTTGTTPVEGPYGGTAAAIPGTVQAANYDTGGQGVAYNVSSVNGTGNSYRSDGVDLEACTDTGSPGCGDDLGWTGTGQWFKYTVNVATAGTYTLGLRLASPSAVTDGLHIANSSGANLSGNINVPATGGYQTWSTVNTTVTLPAGQQTLTLNQDNGGWNIRYMAFTSAGGPYGGTPAAVPGTVQAANYDTGGPGVGYNVTSTNGTANSYRSDGVDLEACTDTGSPGCGDDLGWTGTGQWFNYTVNVASAGTYTVTLRLAAPSAVTDALHIANSSGTNLSGNINIPATGAFQTWANVTATVTLPAGQQTLTLDEDNGGWNIRYMTFASSGTTTTGINTSAWYEVVNANSGLCASAAGAATANGTAVQQLACTGATSQLWQFVPTSVSGEYEVLNDNAQSEGESWNITGGVSATASGTLLQIWNYGGTGNTNALFAAQQQSNGDYTFVADNSGLCIDTPGSSTASGVQLQQYTCNSTTAQAFNLVQS